MLQTYSVANLNNVEEKSLKAACERAVTQNNFESVVGTILIVSLTKTNTSRLTLLEKCIGQGNFIIHDEHQTKQLKE